MFCSHCGKEIRDDASFCPECGTPVYRKDETQKAAENLSLIHISEPTRH